MAGEGDKFVVVGVLVGSDGGLLDGADPFPLMVYPLQKSIDIVSEFGLRVKSRQIWGIGNRNNGGG
jgi:hypothetical protein